LVVFFIVSMVPGAGLAVWARQQTLRAFTGIGIVLSDGQQHPHIPRPVLETPGLQSHL
jgi:hypothetical protein